MYVCKDHMCVCVSVCKCICNCACVPAYTGVCKLGGPGELHHIASQGIGLRLPDDLRVTLGVSLSS